jgi:hypothetical protein
MGNKTWVTEEVLASADVNNLLMKQSVIACTSGTRPGTPVEGMFIYETDTDTYRGYDGSTWQEVFMLNPPRAEVTRTTAQNITDSTQTTVTWQASNYNYRTMWSSGVNPSRLTVPSGMGGLYRVSSTVEYAMNGNGTRQVALMKNGGIVGRSITTNAGSGQDSRVFYSREIVAAAGDYFEVALYQNSGSTLALNVVQTTPFLQARRVGPS